MADRVPVSLRPVAWALALSALVLCVLAWLVWDGRVDFGADPGATTLVLLSAAVLDAGVAMFFFTRSGR